MALSLDHVVIYVNDLNAAMDDYREAGFTVNYGGQHADGITENGLIVFADGTYLELIALVEGKHYAEANFKALIKEHGVGYTGYALQSDNIEADLGAIRERGVAVSEIRDGGRARPDGVQLQWKSARIDDGMSPFVIQDISERHLRVPQDEAAINHTNGATGIHELLIQVQSFSEATDFYGKIMGAPLVMKGVARFQAGASSIVVTAMPDAESIPHMLSLYTDYEDPVHLDLHGAKLVLI